MEKLNAQLKKTEREKRNALDRERRAKLKCADYLVELKTKNLLTAELEDKLDVFNGNKKLTTMFLCILKASILSG